MGKPTPYRKPEKNMENALKKRGLGRSKRGRGPLKKTIYSPGNMGPLKGRHKKRTRKEWSGGRKHAVGRPKIEIICNITSARLGKKCGKEEKLERGLGGGGNIRRGGGYCQFPANLLQSGDHWGKKKEIC